MFLLQSATYRTLVRYDPTIGHLYVPNVVARLPNENGGYFVRTNASGFRSDVEFDPAPGPRPRILFFGDSFTAADGCSNEDRFAELVGASLDAEVYNFGLSGSAPDQHLLIFERFAREIHADLIVLAVSVHNIERIKLHHRPSIDQRTGRPVLIPKPYIELAGAELRWGHIPVPRVRPELEPSHAAEYDEEGHFDPPLLQRLYFSPLVQGIRDLGLNAFPQIRAHVRGFAYRSAGVQLYEDYLDRDSLGWRLLSATIRRFHESAGETPVLVVPLPTYHYYVDRLEPAYQPVFDSLADPSTGLYVYGLTSDLVAGKKLRERQKICFEQDAHYSPFGHREIARCIAGEIGRLGLLPKPGGATEPRRGADTATNGPRRVLARVHGDRPAAALVEDGRPVAAALEEWFHRRMTVPTPPAAATNHCLEERLIHQDGLEACVEVGARSARRSPGAEVRTAWRAPQGSLVGPTDPSPELAESIRYRGPTYSASHALAQCAAAFYPSPLHEAAVLSVHESVDGTVAAIARGSGRRLEVVEELAGHVGLDTVASRTARLLGLSGDDPWTELDLVATEASEQDEKAVESSLMAPAGGGTFTAPAFDEGAAAAALGLVDTTVDARRGPLAAALIAVAGRLLGAMAARARSAAGCDALCVVGAPLRSSRVREIVRSSGGEGHVYDGDQSGAVSAAVGAALLVAHQDLGEERAGPEASLLSLGPAFSVDEVEAFLDTEDVRRHRVPEGDLARVVADVLGAGERLGYYEGRTCGARPEHARAILVTGRSRGDVVEFGGRLHAVRSWPESAGNATLSGHGVGWIPLRLPEEGIAVTPADAYRCITVGGLDALLVGPYLVRRAEQPHASPPPGGSGSDGGG